MQSSNFTGLGETALLTLQHKPASYTAVKHDKDAAALVERFLHGPEQRCVVGFAENTPDYRTPQPQSSTASANTDGESKRGAHRKSGAPVGRDPGRTSADRRSSRARRWADSGASSTGLSIDREYSSAAG